VTISYNVNLIQMTVAFGFLQRGVYLVFSNFSKDSATDSPHLKEIQSQKTWRRSSETPEKGNTRHSLKKQNLTCSITDSRCENLRI
jgi:hypothetical protein